MAKNSKFPADKGRFDKPIPTVLLLCQREMCFCSFIASLRQIPLPSVMVNYDTWGVRLREREQKKNPIFTFTRVPVRFRESVRLPECVNTEFDWEVKRGFEKASLSRAAVYECPLAES